MTFSHEPPDYVCPLCMISVGTEGPPADTVQDDIVYRDEFVTAFIASEWRMNNPGHVLIIPNAHFENIYVLPDDIAGRLASLTRLVALALKDAYRCDGVSTAQHNEPAGYQHVWHYHTHVFPRWDGDNIFQTHKRDTTPEERKTYADKVRACFPRNL